MRNYYKYQTKVGTFYLAKSAPDGLRSPQWHIIYNDKSLGGYNSIVAALDDLVGGSTVSVLYPKTGKMIETDELGIPDDLGEWERIA